MDHSQRLRASLSTQELMALTSAQLAGVTRRTHTDATVRRAGIELEFRAAVERAKAKAGLL